MKKKSILSLLLTTSLFSGCMSGGQGYAPNNRGEVNSLATQQTTSINQPITLKSKVKNSLSYMYDEERLAKEVYLAIYEKQPVQQLSKIASKAEGRHIDAVKNLAQRYGVATPYQQRGKYLTAHIQSLYNNLYAKGIRSRKDALEVGCMVEVIDVDDLNKYMNEAQKANAQDVLQTYSFLRKGSYNHYWAFDKGLKQIGVSNGCCSLGDKYCHPEYPKKERGQHGGGQGRGQGRMGGGWGS